MQCDTPVGFRAVYSMTWRVTVGCVMLYYDTVCYLMLGYAILWTCERHLDTPKTLNAGTGMCEINIHFNLAVFLHVLTPLPVFQSCRKDAGQQLTKMSVYFTDRLHSMCVCS